MSLGARPVRTDADAHDRLLALTSHLPHALANLLMLRVADAAADTDEPLAFASASLREMTRLAGANAAVWSDIFLGNADEIVAALGGFRTSLDELEQALRAGDRETIETSIAAAAEARNGGDSPPDRAGQLNRIRASPDRPGVLARITQISARAAHRGLRASATPRRVRRRAGHLVAEPPCRKARELPAGATPPRRNGR